MRAPSSCDRSVDNQGWTPSHTAAAMGHAETLRALLWAAPDTARKLAPDAWFLQPGGTPLHAAAAGGHVAAARCLLAVAPDLLTARTTTGRTPLHVAALAGHLEMVQLLLEQAPWPATLPVCEAVDAAGELPIHLAVLVGQTDLLEVGKPGSTARRLKVVRGDLLWPRHVWWHERTDMPLLARDGLLQVLLHAAPHTVAARTRNGDSTLHLAAARGPAASVELLVAAAPALQFEGGAGGKTAMHLAARRGKLDVMQVLSPNVVWSRDQQASLPIHAAASTGRTAAVQLLLAIDPSTAAAVNVFGETALHIALNLAKRVGNTAAAECLIGTGPPSFVLARLAEVEAADLATLRLPEESSHQLYAAFAAFHLANGPLADGQWERLPRQCSGIGRALAAALACSPAQAQQVVQRLPPADAERLRCAALCLARTLPPAAMESILCDALAD